MGHSRPAAAAGELVIVGWGGAHEESLKKAVYDPFTAATGIKIKQVSATNQLALLKAQVQNNQPGVGHRPAGQRLALARRSRWAVREARCGRGQPGRDVRARFALARDSI